jgi:hypothetical protein
VPQSGQVQVRTFRGFGPSRWPHAEHSWLDGNLRSTLTRVRPYRLALYSSMAVNWPHPASWIDLANDVTAWIAAWNDDPRPFVWTKTADEILDNLARYLHLINNSGH